MNGLAPLGRLLILTGLLLVLVGALFLLGKYIPFLGRLPGDFSFERKGVHIFFPLATCLVISAVLSLLLNWITRR